MFSCNNSLSPQRKTVLLNFQKKAGFKFKNLKLLNLAFHHRSFSHIHEASFQNNERLEFLGDSVLGLVTASCLYNLLSDCSEGELAKTKAVLVSEETLSDIALSLDVDKYIMLGRGEEMSGGRRKKAILADAMEAIIGALYLDSGFKVAEKFVLRIITPKIPLVRNENLHMDYKSALQELSQKKFQILPLYTVVKAQGPDHDRTFWVEVQIHTKKYGPATGKSKKEAAQAVAELAWNDLHKSEK
ncbi:ribonuclease III [Treponema phagedenis]|uniref:ribonuclease III n=1 Tax=Treponema phagedenis TaxID=162 RepID=UPI0001F63C58|nr:ribonuclease III [Treponema phagedenis]EFW37945.1 ribonuclease III [Treponema phagedenis F0421]TYT76884.1 ribonuclease III [Treponema phagedenis]TYT79826.1 ribonuclease III [Treponema phagedenis]